MYDIFWEIEFNILKTDSFFLCQKSIGAAISLPFLVPYTTPRSEHHLESTLIMDCVFDLRLIGQQKRIKIAL